MKYAVYVLKSCLQGIQVPTFDFQGIQLESPLSKYNP